MESLETGIDFENSIGPWLGRTVKTIDFYFQEVLKEHGFDLTKEQMVVLKKLHDKDGINQNELAFLTLRNKSSLTRLLSKMEKRTYITRLACKEDKRVKQVYLTAFGRDIFLKVKPIIRATISIMEEHVSADEKQQVIAVLRKIQTNLGATAEHI